jgi:SAM-dependent methyltransferase
VEFEEYRIMYEAEDSHWWYHGLRSVMFTLLDLKPRAGTDCQPRILDAGCGTGGNLHALRRAGYANAEGFDYSPIALEFCKLRGLDNVRYGSITDIPFEDCTFDIVISCDVVTDTGTKDEAKAYEELLRVLKPGGRLFLNAPAFEFLRSEHDRATDVARRYTRRELKRKLADAGFRIGRVTYWNMLLFPAVVAVRLGRRERPEDLARPARSDIMLPPAPINALLSALMSVESIAIRWVDLPLGSSVAALAYKPTGRGTKLVERTRR